MSADYDRLFHSSDPAQPEEETVTVDRESAAGGRQRPCPPMRDARKRRPGRCPSRRPRPKRPQLRRRRRRHVRPRSPARLTPTHVPGHAPRGQRHDAGTASGDARRRAVRTAAARASTTAGTPGTRAPSLPALRRTTAREPGGVGDGGAGQTSGPVPTSAASIGNHRAIDALSHVGVRSAVKMPSQRGWRHVIYLLTRINLGLSPDELYELDLHARIRRNARDSYQIGVFGLKGGVGKTAVTVGARFHAEQDPRRPDSGRRRRSRRRQPRRSRRAAVRGDRRGPVVGQGIEPLQRYSRIHQHERLQPRGAVLRGIQRRPS